MSIHVEIPDPLAEKVARAAASKGKSPEALVIEAIETQLDPWARLNAALAPIRQTYEASGLSEDDAVELFESEKHAMRKRHEAASE